MHHLQEAQLKPVIPFDKMKFVGSSYMTPNGKRSIMNRNMVISGVPKSAYITSDSYGMRDCLSGETHMVTEW